MGLTLSTDGSGLPPRGSFKLPFQEQIDFFNQKLALPSAHYDDILKSAHDRAFIVAGAAKADLLADLHGAVKQAVNEGKTLDWFRGQFDSIVKKHGWTGWTGEGTEAGVAWRTRVIYQTNLSTSYAAGRWAQLNDPDLLSVRPYWKYIHNDSVAHPRALHQSWNGVVLKHDDPWWATHFCPNGWGCRCRIMAVRAKEFKGKAAPNDGTYNFTDRNGVVHTIPKGIDYGFDYAMGQSNAVKTLAIQQNKLENLPFQLAKSNVNDLLASPIFKQFFNGQLAGEFPVAVLNAADMKAIDATAPTVMLSQESLAAHLKKHPEVGLEDYLKIPTILEQGEVYKQGEQRLIYLMLGDVRYRAALKRTQDGGKNYFLTLFVNDKGKPPLDTARVR